MAMLRSLEHIQSKSDLEQMLEEAWDLGDTNPEASLTISSVILKDYSKDELTVAKVNTIIAYYHMRKGEYDLLFEKAYCAFKTIATQESVWLIRLYLALGIAQHVIAELGKALEFFFKGLDLAKKLEITEGIFAAYHNLARHFLLQENYEKAHEYFVKCYDYTQDSHYRLTYLLFNHAHCLAKLGELKEAKAKAQASFKLSTKYDQVRSRIHALMVLADIYLLQDEAAEAIRTYEAAIDLAKQVELPYGHIVLSIASAHYSQTELDTARYLLGQAQILLNTKADIHDLIKYHQVSYQVHEAKDQYAEALKDHKSFFKYSQELYNQESTLKSKAIDIAHQINQIKEESEAIQEKNLELQATIRQLEVAHAKLHEISIKDSLTDLYNRRFFFSKIDQLLAVALRYERPLCLVMLDIDYFKRVNDHFGHQLGDEVLKIVSRLLKYTLRNADLLARYGGDEFVIAMPETNLKNAVNVCERMRTVIEVYSWSEIKADLKVSLSLGVTELERSDTQESLLSRADSYLYEAKALGRNQVNFGNQASVDSCMMVKP